MAAAYFMLKILKRKRTKRMKKEENQNLEENSPRKFYRMSVNCNTFGKRCRVCLKDGNIPIYGDANATNISESIKIFGNIEISEVDVYPKHLCSACHCLLNSAILFRKLAMDSNTLLQQELDSRLPTDDRQTETDAYNSCTDNEHEDPLVNEPEEKPKSCNLSKKYFNSPDEYLTHKNSKQHKNVRIQCPICNRLLTAQLYQRHLARHQSASHLICEVCGKMYRKDNLVRHLQLHSFELPFQCQICPYRGRFMESLKIHMRTHTGDKPFSCDKCQLRFLTRSNLNRHLLTHKKDRPCKCNECGRGFYTKRDLDVHFKSDHAGVKDFGCKTCGNKYGTRKALMRHELRVHNRDKMAKGRMPLYLQAEYRKSIVDT